MAYKSIAAAQADNIKSLDGFSENVSDYDLIDSNYYSGINKVVYEYGLEFQKVVAKYIKNRHSTSSGSLASTMQFKVYEDKIGMDILMNDYFDFPNKGVKGVNSSNNAPDSPYQYKNYGMNAEGRASIKKYIESGKAKVETIQNDKQGLSKAETKQISLIDLKTNTLIYLIKKWGIKASHYLDDAIAETFKNLPTDLAELVALKIKENIAK